MILSFTCPWCNQHEIEEVLHDAILLAKVQATADGNVEGLGVTDILDGKITHYQCHHCGYVLQLNGRPIVDNRELVECLALQQHPKVLWQALGNVPTYEDDQGAVRLDEDFLHFAIGDKQEVVWHWFEEAFNLNVHDDLMFTGGPND